MTIGSSLHMVQWVGDIARSRGSSMVQRERWERCLHMMDWWGRWRGWKVVVGWTLQCGGRVVTVFVVVALCIACTVSSNYVISG